MEARQDALATRDSVLGLRWSLSPTVNRLADDCLWKGETLNAVLHAVGDGCVCVMHTVSTAHMGLASH
jgi:uncharacterized protein YoxC